MPAVDLDAIEHNVSIRALPVKGERFTATIGDAMDFRVSIRALPVKGERCPASVTPMPSRPVSIRALPVKGERLNPVGSRAMMSLFQSALPHVQFYRGFNPRSPREGRAILHRSELGDEVFVSIRALPVKGER